jgi:hypothetical protein
MEVWQMTRRRVAIPAGAAAVALLLGGCALGSGEELSLSPSDTALANGGTLPVPPTYSGSAIPVPASSGAPATSGASSRTATAPASADPQAAVTGLHDGTWLVGDAGQVDFRLAGGTLELSNAQPATGWTKQVPVKTPQQIEVRFLQDATTWTFDVAVKGNSMTIVKEQSVTDAQPGAYGVADAGSVSWTTTSGSLAPQAVESEAGWQVTAQQASTSAIDVSFAQGARTASFAARTTGGSVVVTTRASLTGPTPS